MHPTTLMYIDLPTQLAADTSIFNFNTQQLYILKSSLRISGILSR